MSATDYPYDDGEPAVSFWHRLSRLLWVVLTLSVVAIVLAAFLPELRQQHSDQAMLKQLHDDIDAQRKLHTHRKRQFDWLTNNPEYMEVQAREKFGMMKPGETIYRLDESKDSGKPLVEQQRQAAPSPSPAPRGSKSR